MRRLNTVNRGAAPKALVNAVDACVIPVATYGAEVWWPGMSRPTITGSVRPHTSFHCELIDKVIIKALRAALPVWRTTPNVVLHREGGIPPARILLEGYRLRLSARLNSLDDRHPLRFRATLRQLPKSEAAEPLPAPVYTPMLGTKADIIQSHRRWICSISTADICAYSDGSSEGHGRSSWGYVLQRGGDTFKRGHGILHGGEVYDAEIFGATMALRAALSARQNNENIFILLDNQAAVMALQTGNSSSNIRLTYLFHNLAKTTNAEFRWVSGHSNIGGNEEADAEARIALRDLPERNTRPHFISLSYLWRLMQQRRQELVDKWWSEVCPARYQDLDLKMRRKKSPELALPRRLLHKLLAARTGHGDFAAYHRRLNHIDANLECVCGQETSPIHFIRCRRHANKMRKLRNGMSMDTFRRQLLGHNCLKKFTEFVRITGCFDNQSSNSSSAGREESI
ncbi:hypothetical protein K3495_g3155 [Podosphaera aphanis]|nr:hypothetical protein K3495_g3155 [Podosphaera aphanis]